MDWNGEITDEDDGRAASATDPAMDAWTFSKVVEGQAERLVELARSIDFTVEQLIGELENGDEHLPLSAAMQEAESCIEELTDQANEVEAHVPGIVEHARALLDLYCDEARRRHGRPGWSDLENREL